MTGEVRRSGSADELAELVAAALVGTIADVQAQGRVPAIALTGGTIAAKIHEAVAGSADAGQVDWGRVDVWFGDERFVPPDDPDRNAGQAGVLLDALPFDPARVHPMPAADGVTELAAAAAAYGEELRSQGSGGFDVLMLSLGPDGHVASLFPGSPQLDVHDAIAIPVTNSPKPPPERITLSFEALNRAREVWFLVSGAGKAEIAARAAGDRRRPPGRARGARCRRARSGAHRVVPRRGRGRPDRLTDLRRRCRRACAGPGVA